MKQADENKGGGNVDWATRLDLGRTTAIKDFVDRFENAMRAAEAAADDLKEIVAQAKEAEFGPRDIQAMKKIAKFRLKDQRADAREQIEALHRIGKAVDFDLFDWADVAN